MIQESVDPVVSAAIGYQKMDVDTSWWSKDHDGESFLGEYVKPNAETV